MRILVVTRAPWLNDNGIGNTLTDLFSDFPDAELFGICMREAPVVSNLCKKNYYMSERQIINHIMKKTDVGRITGSCLDINEQQKEIETYIKAKKLNLTIFQLVREALWGSGVWKNDSLNIYLKEVNPDVVFFPDFPCIYAHKILKYIKDKTKAKIAIFHADDCYTLKQFSLSPLYWIYRFYQRKWVRESVRLSDFHYVISNVQKKDYDKAFKVKNKILTKFGDFSSNPNLKEKYNNPLQIVYTGNIGLNRWKSLAIIVTALKRINKNETRAKLIIYTSNKITKKIKRALTCNGTSEIMGKAEALEIPKIQNNADILVHVEAFNIKNRLAVRQSFSTKIVDYFKRSRTILAVGPYEVASIKHLIDNDCALVADCVDKVEFEINRILNNKELLNVYANKAYECGKKYHNRDDMLKMLYCDFRK